MLILGGIILVIVVSAALQLDHRIAIGAGLITLAVAVVSVILDRPDLARTAGAVALFELALATVLAVVGPRRTPDPKPRANADDDGALNTQLGEGR